MQQDKTFLGTEPVGKLLWRLGVPTVIAQLVNMLYNIVDRIYIGHMPVDGSLALTGVGVCMPLILIVSAFSAFVASGGAPRASIAMGRGNDAEAEKILGGCFMLQTIISVILTAVMLLWSREMLLVFGASENTIGFAMDYMSIYALGTLFVQLTLGMNAFITAQGFATVGMQTVLIGAVLNIVLDPILIFGLKLGTAGAAIATAVSQLVSFTILLLMTNRRASAISISWKNFTPTAVIYKKMLSNGFPSLARQGIASVSTILLNTTAGAWGDAAIAAMSIVSRYLMFINSSIIGFGQGFQPVCGFCYGAGKYSRVRQAYTYCIRVGTVVLLVLGAISFIFAKPIITLFRRDDLEVIRIGTTALQLQLLSLPLWAFITLSNMCTQAMGLGMKATLISIARQGIFLIPALLILPRVFGLLGLQMAQPIADLCTAIFAFFIVHKVMQELKNRPDVV